MSFEDDMIEEGFNDAQEYLDYLCAKADDNCDDNYDEEEAHYERLLRKEKQELEAPFRAWKKNDSIEVSIWALIWERYWRVVRFYGSYDEFHYWMLWRESDSSYLVWENEHKPAIDVILEHHFASFFADYYSRRDIINVINNNRWLIDYSDSASDCLGTSIDDNEVLLRAWKDVFVANDTNESILFEYWVTKNKAEWINWLHVNYPRIKRILVDNYASLSSLYRELEKSQRLSKKVNLILSAIAKEQMKDWWDLFVADIQEKYIKAKECNYNELFNTSSRKKRADRIVLNPINEIYHDLKDLVDYANREDNLKRAYPLRPFSHPKVKCIKAILPGSFRDDLLSIAMDGKEKAKAQEIINKRHFNLYDIEIEYDERDFDFFLNEDTESTFDYESSQKRFAKQKELKHKLLKKRTNSFLPRSYKAYLKTIPEQSIDYEDYEYLGYGSSAIYYFCNNIRKEMLDGMIDYSELDSSKVYEFQYKTYGNNIAFNNNELKYTVFNNWCFLHHIPTFNDYIIKYWFDSIANKKQVLLDLWLNYWRGKQWIQINYGNTIEDSQLFEIWKANHSQEWNSWLKNHFREYKKYFIIAQSLLHWIRKGGYSLTDVISHTDNEVIKLYDQYIKNDFDSWLKWWLPSGIDFKTWRKNIAPLIPILKARYDKIRILDLWNELHPHNKITIEGLND